MFGSKFTQEIYGDDYHNWERGSKEWDSQTHLNPKSNNLHKLTSLGKAGRSRWLNRRPIVRGVAMNPVDHPHGGGEGKTSGGRPSVTPWGFPAKGRPTRKKKSHRFIIKNKKNV